MTLNSDFKPEFVTLQDRYNGLDFSRAILLLLGIFYHAALVYRGDNSWRVVSNYSSEFLFTLTDFTTDFRMEGFYLISAFFFLMLFEKNRPNFLMNRLFRIIVPLIFVTLTINNYLRFSSANYDYSSSFKYYIFLGQWLEHLWFLGNLVCYFIIGRVVAPVFLKLNEESRVILLLALLFTPIFSALLEPISYFFHYDKVFFITVRPFFYYFPYFLLGFFCYQFRRFFLKIFNYYFAFFSLSLYLIIKLMPCKYFACSFAEPYILSALATFGVIALLNKIGSQEFWLIRKITDAGYTIYLTHTAVIVFLYTNFFEGFYLDVHVSYFMMCIFVFFITFCFHFYVVSRFSLMKFIFNGVWYKS